MQEQLAEIEVQKETEIAQQQETSATVNTTDEPKKDKTSRVKSKHSVATGRGAGRPARKGVLWDKNGNEIDPSTGKAKSKWGMWNLRT